MNRTRLALCWHREDSVTLRAGDYSVNRMPDGRYDAWRWPVGGAIVWSSVLYRTQRDAIAACERHAAKCAQPTTSSDVAA